MASNSVIAVKNFDINKLSFGEIKKLDNNGKYIPMYYDKNPFVIQTPQCYAPYGMNIYKDEKTGNESYSLELSFKDKDSREPLQKFFSILEEIDKKVIEATMENSQAWIRKPANKDVIEALYTPTIKYPKDKETGEIITKYPPTYRLKLNKDAKGNFRCVAYDQETKEETLMETVIPKMKGSKVTAIANCSGIWVAGSKFGISLKASQLMVAVNSGINRFAFQEIPEDNIESSEPIKTTAGNDNDKDKDKEESDEVPAQVTTNDVETSDDDDSDEDDDASTKEPVKKVVAKKPAAAKK
jgi:hypothetical protein